MGRRCHIGFSTRKIIHDIISYNCIHSMSTTDQYRWSYGSASVGFETPHVSIKLRRAVSSLILVRCRRSLHVNLAIYVNYRLCNRDVSVRRMAHAAGIVAAWCQISHTCVHNTITSSIWRFFLSILSIYYCLLVFLMPRQILRRSSKCIGFILPSYQIKHCLHHPRPSKEKDGDGRWWKLCVVRVQRI